MKSRRILVVFVILATFVGCQFRKNKVVPEHLMGVWKTTEKRYADRFFELKKNLIIFGTGGDTFTTHPIMSIEVQEVPEERKILYEVYYLTSEGGEYRFSFYHHPAQDVIRFSHQQQFKWTKQSAD